MSTREGIDYIELSKKPSPFTSYQLIQQIEQNYQQLSEILKLYHVSCFDELKWTNKILFSIILFIKNQLPLTSYSSKSLKKQYESTFNCKTFVSYVTNQLHKQSIPLFTLPSLNNFRYNPIIQNMLENDEEDDINILLSRHSEQLFQDVCSSSFKNNIYNLKQPLTKVQAEKLGQFLLESSVIVNVKDKKRPFTFKKEHYQFNDSAIAYYGELLMEEEKNNILQDQVIEVMNRRQGLEDKSSSLLPQTMYLTFPTIFATSGAVLGIINIGSCIEKASLHYQYMKQSDEFLAQEQRIQGIQDEYQEAIGNSSSSTESSSNPFPETNKSGLTEEEGLAFPAIYSLQQFKKGSRRSKTRSRKLSLKRMSVDLVRLRQLSLGKDSEDLIIPEYFKNKTSGGDFELNDNISNIKKITSLAEALKDKAIFKEFKEFCIKDHSEENILCYEQILNYKSLSTEEERKKIAKEIYEQFINDENMESTPINLSSHESEAMRQKMTIHIDSTVFSIDFFDSLELSLTKDMQDIFTRFNEERNKRINGRLEKLNNTEESQQEEDNKQTQQQHNNSFISQVSNAFTRMRSRKPLNQQPLPLGHKRSKSANRFLGSEPNEENGDLFLSLSPSITPRDNNQNNNQKEETPSRVSSFRFKYDKLLQNGRKQLVNSIERLSPDLYEDLETLLKSEIAREQFRRYCIINNAEECIFFYEAVEEYKLINDIEERKKRAKEIYDLFLKQEQQPFSLLEDQGFDDCHLHFTLNCSDCEREYIEKQLESGDSEIFNNLHLVVVQTMVDVFQRFVSFQKEWKAMRMMMK
ncbi:hypothetical protein ABK040_011062 [Willaertia magna]